VLIVVTNARVKLAALRIVLLFGLLLLIGLSFNNLMVDVAENEDLNHAPGQPVRVENPAKQDLGKAAVQASPGVEQDLTPTPADGEAGEDWFGGFVSKLKEYYQGGR